jgi:DNA replication protein DnaC
MASGWTLSHTDQGYAGNYRDRYKRGYTIFATQLPVSEWHSRFEDPTLASAIMDRVVHNAYRLKLKGESKRKRQKNLTQSGH